MFILLSFFQVFVFFMFSFLFIFCLFPIIFMFAYLSSLSRLCGVHQIIYISFYPFFTPGCCNQVLKNSLEREYKGTR